MLNYKLKAGTRVLIGAPAAPMPRDKSDAIAALVASIAGVSEAHLPQCFIEGMEQAAQVLIVVVDLPYDPGEVAKSLGDWLDRTIKNGETLDFLPLKSSDPILKLVREAGCMIYCRKPTPPWWKFW